MNAAPFRRHLGPLALLIALPVLANALVLSGLLRNDPALFTMYLTGKMTGRPMLASPGWFDPTIGLITQPLGMLSAKDWLSGVMPWWNPYSGAGMPLAAEMQTMSFFLPFVLLLKFWPGWLLLKVLLQVLCGIFTYALLIELEASTLAATVAGGLFALNATFFLVPHAMGTLPFAPLLLLGLERAQRAAREGRTRGWGLIPLALAYTIYGGYPEVAYIDGTLAAVWAIWRFATLGPARARFAGKVALGTGIGLALTLPLVVPFLQYAGLSYLGTHATKYAWLWLLPPGAPVQLFPFIYGPIGAPTPVGLDPGLANLIAAYWVQSAGWFGPVAAIVALAALGRRGRHRGLAWVLFGFVAFWEARIWGFPPAIWLIDQLPLMARTDAMRFCTPALELAVFVMAGLAVDAWQRDGEIEPARLRWLAAAALAIAAVPLCVATQSLIAWFAAAPGRLDFALGVSGAEMAAAIAALILLGREPRRRAVAVLAVLMLADPFAASILTTLGAPRHAKLDLGGVAYLQKHLGLARFYSLRPFAPNYPAAWRLATIDENQSPVPAAWNRYLHKHLDPYADVLLFTWSQPRHLGCVLLPHAKAALEHGVFVRPTRQIVPSDPAAELRRNLTGYETLGVKYVLAPPDLDPFLASATLPVDAASRVPLALGPGASLKGTVPAGTLDIGGIDRVDVLIGTYQGAAQGRLKVKLCADSACAKGAATLAGARDNAPLPIRLDHKLAVPTGVSLRYRISHGIGHPVALWLGALDPLAPPQLAAGAAGRAPVLDFAGRAEGAPEAAVYADSVMRIYRLKHPAPLFAAAACRLTPHGIDRVEADCSAPATLRRLEADYPGWRARVNGRPASIMKTGEMFQALALPAGRSDVRFFYRPSYGRMSLAAALAALALWVGLMIWPSLRKIFPNYT
ncbi:MAG: hypothetical protein ACYCZB_08030 [Acidiphilium sp.]